jgi:hypothetical protein
MHLGRRKRRFVGDAAHLACSAVVLIHATWLSTQFRR